MIQPNYVMKAKVTRVVDGDTLVLDVSPAFNFVIKDQKFRLYGIDTAEMNAKDQAERDFAKLAKDYVINLNLKNVLLQSIKTRSGTDLIDSFGRYLAVIYFEADGVQINLNQRLLDLGLARVWKG